MSLAGLWPKSGQQGSVLYKGDKGVHDATRPPAGGPAEAGGHMVSSLPSLDSARSHQSQKQINAVGVDAGVSSVIGALSTFYAFSNLHFYLPLFVYLSIFSFTFCFLQSFTRSLPKT